jgi:hypothetical protein
MRFGISNIRRLYGEGSLVTVLKELSKQKLDLTGVREVRWDRGGTEPAGEYTLFYGEGKERIWSFFFTSENHISRYEGRV